jgi:hypothetical protein
MQTRKVGAEIPLDQHIELTSLAKTHSTTVGALVQLGLQLVIDELKNNPKAAKTLARDNRLS